MRKIEKCLDLDKNGIAEITFLDLLGNIRKIYLPTYRLPEAFKNGLKCDGSSISCAKKVTDSDMLIFASKDSCRRLPNGNLIVFGETSHRFDARKNLREIEAKVRRHIGDDAKINFGAELEFFLFEMKDGKIDKSKLDDDRYFFEIKDKYLLTLKQTAQFLLANNFCVEAFHHECGKSQFELDFKFDTPTKTADNIVYVKQVLQYFARQNGLYACFEPKPIKNTAGSGMHINMSFCKDKKNLFFSKGKTNMSMQKFIDGIIGHIGAITALANPTPNSYKRLNSKMETPSKICANANDRTALLRIPKADKRSARVELRSPDPSCNPYLAFASILLSGFDEVFGGKEFRNIPKKLPTNLKSARKFLTRDKLLLSLVPTFYTAI